MSEELKIFFLGVMVGIVISFVIISMFYRITNES